MSLGQGRLITTMIAALLLAGALASCGGSSSNNNAAKIESAESEAAEIAAVEKEAEANLRTYETSVSAGPWFRAGPGECSFNDVDVGEDAALQEDNDQAVVSPDGDVAITTVPVIEINGPDASQADCLKAVVDAMGWDE